jgi:beta-lactamase regulating signal transducer with metallopeptidase domain
VIAANAIALANHLWQSTVFGIAVWLVTLAFRKNRAAVRHGLWLIASVKFLIPFSALTALGTRLQWLVSVPAPPRFSVLVQTFGQPFGASATVVPEGATSSVASGSIVTAALFLWIFGSVVSMVWWAVQWFRLRQIVSEAVPVELHASIRVREHHGRLEPGVFGIFQPVLLLPQGISDRLRPEQLEAVFAHELSHVRRRDNLTAAIHMFVEALYWFHPLVWWIKHRLIDEQERACDEEVLRLGGDPQVYAESILKVCECYLAAPSMCVSGITSSNLKRRIEEIMKNRAISRLSWSRIVLLTVAAMTVLVGPIIIGGTRAAGTQGSRGGEESVALQGYRIMAIDLRGYKVLGTEAVRSALGLRPGEIYDESMLRKGFENLKKMYGDLGYVEFLPQPGFDIDERRRFLTLTITIDEGPQYSINRIRFVGNTRTPDEVLRRELLVKEGAVFNLSLLQNSLANLNQLGLIEPIHFEDAQIDISPGEPKVDVSLRVKEKAH